MFVTPWAQNQDRRLSTKDYLKGRKNRIRLNPLQSPVVSDLRERMKKDPHGRAYVTFPSGSGKTILFSHLAHGVQATPREAQNNPVLIVVPTVQLLDQTAQKLELTKGHQARLGYYYNGDKTTGRPITLTTYHSWMKHPGAFPNDRFKLVIFDEAHHLIAPKRRKRLEAYKGFKLGLTATPATTLGHLQDVMGTNTHHLGLTEAIGLGVLPDVKYFRQRTHVDLSQVKIDPSTGDFNRSELRAAVNDQGRNLAAVMHYKEKHPGERTVMFTAGVKHAQDLAGLLSQKGVKAEAVWGGMGEKSFKDALDRYHTGATHVLTAAEILTEGVDEPLTRNVYLLRPTLSPRVFFQQIGRALRPHPDKPHACVTDFVDNWKKNDLRNPIHIAPLIEIEGKAGSDEPQEQEGVSVEVPKKALHRQLDFLYAIHQAPKPDFSRIPLKHVITAIQTHVPDHDKLTDLALRMQQVPVQTSDGKTETHYVHNLMEHPDVLAQAKEQPAERPKRQRKGKHT